MPTIRERLANIILRPERQRLESAASIFMEMYERGPAVFPIETILSRLGELDSQYIDLLIRQMQNQTVMMDYTSSEETRLRTVWTSRQMYDTNVTVEAAVDMWTDFGFGMNIEITPKDENAVPVWEDFWLAPENSYLLSAQEIFKLSKDLLVDGDFLLLFFTNTFNGHTTIRKIETEKIKGGPESDGIIALPEDKSVPVLYCRDMLGIKNAQSSEYYYIDWRANEAQVRDVVQAHDLQNPVIDAQNGTKVRAMMVTHRSRRRRGWPLMTTGFTWADTHNQFLQDRAAVARAVAMYTDKLIAQGGQGVINQIKSRLQSSLAAGDAYDRNPRPTAGSTWIENEALTRERMPLGTGAGDAMDDGAMLKAQVGLSARIYNHWLGSGESYRLATATSMEVPVQRAFNRYQQLWSDVWQNIAIHVLTMAEVYGGKQFETKDISSSTDALIGVDMDAMQKAINGFTDLVDRSLLDQTVSDESALALLRVVLQGVGVTDIEDIFDMQPEQPAPNTNPDEEVPPAEKLTAQEIMAWLRNHRLE